MLVKVETWGGRGGGAGKNGNSHKNENGSPVIGVEKIGNLGSGSCSSIGTLNYGDGKSVQALGGRKITGKAGEMAAEKGDRLLKGGKFVSKKSEGLRFVILTDYVEEEHIAANNLAPSNEIVSKISNQITSNDKQIIPTVNKYLIDPAGGKGKFTEPLQENMKEFDDSGVLQSLHRDLLSTGVADAQHVTTETDHSSFVGGNSGPVINQIDIANVSNFEETASKLKEAMDIVLE
ncbi:hypothetical protein QYF36_005096 [Acer negundo]|nr:hypothetical protein QYF36_005096 [Acer negundo]